MRINLRIRPRLLSVLFLSLVLSACNGELPAHERAETVEKVKVPFSLTATCPFKKSEPNACAPNEVFLSTNSFYSFLRADDSDNDQWIEEGSNLTGVHWRLLATPGVYRLNFPSSTGFDIGTYLKSARSGNTDLLREPLTIKRNTESEPILLEFGPSASFWGMTTEHGQPVHAHITIVGPGASRPWSDSEPPPWQWAKVSSEPTPYIYRVTDTVPGTYFVCAWPYDLPARIHNETHLLYEACRHAGHEISLQEGEVKRLDLEVMNTLPVEPADASTDESQLQTPEEFLYSAQLFTEKDEPVEVQMATKSLACTHPLNEPKHTNCGGAAPMSFFTWQIGVASEAEAGGRGKIALQISGMDWDLSVPPGIYRYGYPSLPSSRVGPMRDFYLKSAKSGDIDLLKDTIEIKPGMQPIQVVLALGATIEGSTTENGEPIVALVRIVDPDHAAGENRLRNARDWVMSKRDSSSYEGPYEYRMEGMRPGTYYACAERVPADFTLTGKSSLGEPSCKRSARMVTLTEGQKLHLALELTEDPKPQARSAK